MLTISTPSVFDMYVLLSYAWYFLTRVSPCSLSISSAVIVDDFFFFFHRYKPPRIATNNRKTMHDKLMTAGTRFALDPFLSRKKGNRNVYVKAIQTDK